jgi:hypothetical protein
MHTLCLAPWRWQLHRCLGAVRVGRHDSAEDTPAKDFTASTLLLCALVACEVQVTSTSPVASSILQAAFGLQYSYTSSWIGAYRDSSSSPQCSSPSRAAWSWVRTQHTHCHDHRSLPARVRPLRSVCTVQPTTVLLSQQRISLSG